MPLSRLPARYTYEVVGGVDTPTLLLTMDATTVVSVCLCSPGCYQPLNLVQVPTLQTVKALCILDNDGRRIACKVTTGEPAHSMLSSQSLGPQYFDDTFPSLKEQQKFEENLFSKTHKANGL